MTIHDELVLKLIDPDPKSGKPRGYIINIVGSANIRYVLEEYYLEPRVLIRETVHLVEMTPDIVVTDLKSGKTTAIEIENDIQWDFAHSLQQVKKYRENRREFKDVVVIIPKRYERFAILYKNEGFRVYLWEATRIWECMQCGSQMEEARTIKPKCKKRNCNSKEQSLKGLREQSEDIFEPFE